MSKIEKFVKLLKANGYDGSEFDTDFEVTEDRVYYENQAGLIILEYNPKDEHPYTLTIEGEDEDGDWGQDMSNHDTVEDAIVYFADTYDAYIPKGLLK